MVIAPTINIEFQNRNRRTGLRGNQNFDTVRYFGQGRD
jgi:hypothetical protein